MYLVRTPLNQFPRTVLREISLSDNVFAIHSLSESVCWLFVHDLSEIYMDGSSHSTAQVSRYVFSEQFSHIAPTKPRGHSYDPIGSQASELLNQVFPELRTHVKELDQVWREVLDQEPPNEVKKLARDITTVEIELRDLLSRNHSEDVVSNYIDRFATISEFNIKSCRELATRINDYRAGAEPLGAGEPFSVSIGNVILKSAACLAKDLLCRLGLSAAYRVIPTFGDHTCIYLRLLMPFKDGSDQPTTSRLVLSETHRLRLGALPLIAHELAHLENSTAHGAVISRLLAADYAGYPADILRKVAPHLGQWDGNIEVLSREGGPAQQWAEELVADLVACASCGPSYVYALARFALGSMSQFADRSVMHLSYPPIGDRISLCLSYFAHFSIEVPFESKFISEVNIVDLGSLSDDIVKLLHDSYTPLQHNEAITTVKELLMQGHVIDARPTLILNALWDGVVRRSGYVNELAAVSSILRTYDNNAS